MRENPDLAMSLFERISLKHKQMTIIMLVAGVALVLSCAAFGTYDILAFRKEMVSKLQTLAKIVGDNSAAAIDFPDPDAAADTLALLGEEPHIIGACIYGKDGKVFAEFTRPGERHNVHLPAMQPAGHSFGKDNLILFDSIDYHGETIGTIYIESDLDE